MTSTRSSATALVISVDACSQHHFAADAERAQYIRPMVDKALSRNRRVTFDCSGVRSMSQTFADELIGRLVIKKGESALSRIDFLGCNQTVLTILAHTAGAALRERRARSGNPQNIEEPACPR